jgi:hypothetical protein
VANAETTGAVGPAASPGPAEASARKRIRPEQTAMRVISEQYQRIMKAGSGL